MQFISYQPDGSVWSPIIVHGVVVGSGIYTLVVGPEQPADVSSQDKKGQRVGF